MIPRPYSEAQLLKWFKIQTMKSSDFCVLWDNLMVPANLILNADVKMKKERVLELRV